MLAAWVAAVLTLVATVSHTEGPCLAVHYGREGYKHEQSMARVVANRLACPGDGCIPTFHPRPDVSDWIAVRYADRWRIGENYRALVTFRLPQGGYSDPIWLQPVDYQAPWDVTSPRCRVETSEKLAASMGWSLYANDEGRTTAYILQWEK